CRGNYFFQSKFAALPEWLGGYDGILPHERRLAPSLESSGPREVDGEARRPAGEYKEDRRFSAGLYPTPPDDGRGHPAGLASQTPGEDSARVGNNSPRAIAGVQQGSFGFLKPGGMVFTFRCGQRGTHALKRKFRLRIQAGLIGCA